MKVCTLNLYLRAKYALDYHTACVSCRSDLW